MTLLLAAAVVGYLVGALSPATVVARRGGVDLRGVGSGNPGAANVGRALGRRTGVVVAVLDVLKGAVPAAGFGAVDHRAGLLAGFAAVLGHVSSPLLRGRGGRGVATAAGAVLGAHPLWAPVALVAWLGVLAASRWIALASMAAAVSVLVVALVLEQDRWWALGLAVVVVGRHLPNVRRRLAARREGS
ncbi:MAG: Acyl-phosphate:glycerol-3-phosphate O-acyltransferase PlsY [uncultured Frankineae bacterium]|uniref:Glycerol-3-phosphate acyltransferase n=1 Tax=uncultured Frankineae bacterium TaxID=437475 RepID=A0A6J4M948_9ACTN|nr:MAG: Acyl-phosphate:glycerol-3-phosphate O-acyltransferase PlsY [uncultured Frankineae bacterium]